MHALEKAAMNDPFLADALEGYAFTDNAQGDLEKIKKRLAEKSQNKRIVPLFSQTWIRVAAVVLILGVGGWLLFSNKKQENQFANSTAEKILQKDTQDVAKGTVTNPPLIDSALTDSSSKFSMPDQEIIVSSGPVRKNSGRKLTPPGVVQSETSYNYKSENKSADSLSKKDVVQQNVAAAEMNKDVTAKPSARSAFDRSASENFYRDSQTNDKEALSGKAAGVKVNDTLKNFDVTMKPLNDQVSEVVVTASGQKKSKQYRFENIVVDTLEPSGGWVKYDDYVANNIRVPDEIRQKEVSGVVELSFDVDKNGLATNIKVEKSLCDRCDQEAIRLLKEGPKWTKKKNKKGKLIVRF